MTLRTFILFADYEGLAKVGLIISDFVLLIDAVVILVAIFFKAFQSLVAVVLSGVISLACSALAAFSYWDFSRLSFAKRLTGVAPLLWAMGLLLLFVWAAPLVQYSLAGNRSRVRD